MAPVHSFSPGQWDLDIVRYQLMFIKQNKLPEDLESNEANALC